MKTRELFHIKPWVKGWFWSGVVIGAIVTPIIIGHKLKEQEADIALMVGMLNWILFGFCCWAWAGIEPKVCELAQVATEQVSSENPAPVGEDETAQFLREVYTK
jgi:hypothetical protein